MYSTKKDSRQAGMTDHKREIKGKMGTAPYFFF